MPQNKKENIYQSSTAGGQGAEADFIIIGQGICGTLLSYYLHKEGKSFIVIDDDAADSASKVAAGIINPVTGRRYVASWMIDTFIPFAKQAYTELGEYLDTKLIFQKDIIDFFPSPQMRNAFVNRITEDDTYLHAYPDQNHFNQFFNYDFGCGQVSPAQIVNVQVLLASWRKKLFDLGAIISEKFDAEKLNIKNDHVTYQNTRAQHIIFCDGIASMNNPWFSLLPFSAVKGEALVIECKDLTNEHIYKKGLMLAPLPVQHHYWVGSNYGWEFTNAEPTKTFLDGTTAHLKSWLKVPFEVLFHKAAVRPATIERRPFVGFHPHYNNIGILNGMGTKGTSLAPFFAHQLVQHLVYGFPIMPEVNISRFSRILSHS